MAGASEVRVVVLGFPMGSWSKDGMKLSSAYRALLLQLLVSGIKKKGEEEKNILFSIYFRTCLSKNNY